jgi:hypothetical protein
MGLPLRKDDEKKDEDVKGAREGVGPEMKRR